MTVFITVFAISCFMIFLFGIHTHIKYIQNEKWNQDTKTLMLYKDESKKIFLKWFIALILWPFALPFFGKIIGIEIPLITFLVVFFEVCFALLAFSQGHRLLLICKKLKKKRSM